MSRKRRRGYNNRKGAPRKRREVEVPAPVVPMPRVATGPRTPEERAKHQAMLELIQRTKEQLEREAERDRQFNERYADEPMTPGSVTWHVHDTNRGSR